MEMYTPNLLRNGNDGSANKEIKDGTFMKMYNKAYLDNKHVCTVLALRKMLDSGASNGVSDALENIPGLSNALKKALNKRTLKSRRCHVLKIDEFNRADVQLVLGELYGALDGNAFDRELKHSDHKINMSMVPNLVVIACMNQCEQGLRPLQTSLMRRVHKWYFSVTEHGSPGNLNVFSGPDLLERICSQSDDDDVNNAGFWRKIKEVATQLDTALKNINESDIKNSDYNQLKQCGIPQGYFVSVFQNCEQFWLDLPRGEDNVQASLKTIEEQNTKSRTLGMKMSPKYHRNGKLNGRDVEETQKSKKYGCEPTRNQQSKGLNLII